MIYMSGIDYVILGIIALSALLGVWRGFVREALSLLIWIVAVWFAYAWAMRLEVYLGNVIDDQGLRVIVTFVTLFLAVHIIGFVVSRLLAAMIKSIGLSGVDRVAGAGFGLVRGVVGIAVLVLLAEMTPVQQEAMWQQSYMVSVFKDVLQWVQMHYPLDDIGAALVAQRYGLH